MKSIVTFENIFFIFLHCLKLDCHIIMSVTSTLPDMISWTMAFGIAAVLMYALIGTWRLAARISGSKANKTSSFPELACGDRQLRNNTSWGYENERDESESTCGIHPQSQCIYSSDIISVSWSLNINHVNESKLNS